MDSVLIIDDEPTILSVMEEILCEAGYAVSTAASGSAALEKLKREPPPRLILVDLYMPQMGGKEFLAALGAIPELRDIPVILVTGTIPDPSEFPPQGTYADSIAKPFDINDLLQRVAALIAGNAAKVS
ncbi:response regulator receiver domain-containing protein [Hydrogenispora ethanolica]|uniref:Response regulator receiver domain-containing protein n=1 Tax=Hydrogenispora ethanolica TaxID=1082276 RepID=A0A4R1SBA6_HYDET|nr:response regulator [Hydrogenispora ethanolica]TCL76826.1 response regulator receiver domain-containing protein [Hydrogenispora ethanolica]